MRRKAILFLFIISFFNLNAQSYLKLNGVMAGLGIFNAGVEVGASSHHTYQLDITVSPWQEYLHENAPFIITLGTIGARYYPKEKFNGFYIGPTVGYAAYKMQRFDYWGSDAYQFGSSVFLGADMGYFMRYKRWSFEPTIAFGWHYGIYEGHRLSTGDRYDWYPGKYNISAEWLPFKGGLMIGYTF